MLGRPRLDQLPAFHTCKALPDYISWYFAFVNMYGHLIAWHLISWQCESGDIITLFAVRHFGGSVAANTRYVRPTLCVLLNHLLYLGSDTVTPR
jgi:hypothetical protein